jgi:hypothetical protein
VCKRISAPRGACTWGAGSRCTRPPAALPPPSPEPWPLQPKQPTESTKNHLKQATFSNRRHRQNHRQLRRAPLDSPVTQMTRPEKGPSTAAAAAAAAPPREAEEEATDAAEEGLWWCIPGSTSRAHPLLATTSTPLRDIAGTAAAAASGGAGGTRATHVRRNY